MKKQESGAVGIAAKDKVAGTQKCPSGEGTGEN